MQRELALEIDGWQLGLGFCELARMRVCVRARVGGSVGRHLDGRRGYRDAGYRVCVAGKRRPEQHPLVCRRSIELNGGCVLLAVGRKAHLASRRSLVLRVLELPIIHAEDAVQLVPASHLVAARRYSFYY